MNRIGMPRSPQLLDRRSLEFHQMLAQCLREHPERLERVKRTLARWRVIVAPHSQPYVAEWQRLIDAGLETALAMAVEDSERAAALRQCSPFGSVITPEERAVFFERWSAAHFRDTELSQD
ncbi:hypothetical protein [Diaphorobacter sp.]|uniref:hypothetical protein n=1 Tax=Diaphorobacter sp. TaxID=1934310 RepID=UPI00289B43A6|nr:hypothetical protein [Diaphorobacter sp.]